MFGIVNILKSTPVLFIKFGFLAPSTTIEELKKFVGEFPEWFKLI